MRGVHTEDPRASLTRTQERVGSVNAFNEWITTVGSSSSCIADACSEAQILAEELVM